MKPNEIFDLRQIATVSQPVQDLVPRPSLLKQNLRYILIAVAILIAAAVYCQTNRYYIFQDKGRGQMMKLDKWTGQVVPVTAPYYPPYP